MRRTLRRLKPAKRRTELRYRDRSLLSFVGALSSASNLLLDTTVYIDEMQGKLPDPVRLTLRSASLWHSMVTESELLALTGLLDPAHPDSPRVIEQVTASIERRPAHRILVPDEESWREAGVTSGLLARLQHYGRAERRRAFNNALIFFSASRAGLSVLTRNIVDFDLLLQLAPVGSVIFYEI